MACSQRRAIGNVRAPCTRGGALRRRPLYGFFSAVPRRYDLVNRIITFRLDENWRCVAARECLGGSPARILDLCCGTGDLTLHLARMAQRGVEIVGTDYSAPMLRVAMRKATKAGLGREVSFVIADAADLPFDDGHFDVVGIAFAFRNLSYRNPLRDRYLAEMRRVVAPGGVCFIVESSQPARLVLRTAYHWYLRLAVSRLGGIISGHRGAYRYLAESAANFCGPEEVSRILLDSGFKEVRFRRLMWGVAALHMATR